VVFLASFSLAFSQTYPSIFTTVFPFVGNSFNILTREIVFPVAQFHYTQQQSAFWNGKMYSIPDELFFTKMPRWTLVQSGILSSLEQFFSQYVATTPFYKSTFINNKPLIDAYNTTWLVDIFNNSMHLGYLHGEITQFNLNLFPGFETTDEFQQQVDQLPDTYDNDTCAHFWDFLDFFGTHFVTGAVYGGSLSMRIAYNTSIYGNFSLQWVTDQLIWNSPI